MKGRPKGYQSKVQTGARFGRLVVEPLSGSPLSTERVWVVCDCGTRLQVLSCNLQTDRTKSCGCLRGDRAKEVLTLNLTGRRFGRLTALKNVGPSIKGSGVLWLVRCDCGVEKTVRSNGLLSGKTQSCGCLKREIARRGCAPGEAAKHYYLDKYKRDADRKGNLWGLTDDQFYSVISLPCHYCGIKPTLNPCDGDGVLRTNGVDRVDNTQGYTPENVVPCCRFCQYAKRDLPYSDFMEHLQRVADYKIWTQPLKSLK